MEDEADPEEIYRLRKHYIIINPLVEVLYRAGKFTQKSLLQEKDCYQKQHSQREKRLRLHFNYDKALIDRVHN
jgi:hypothetical protein